MNSWKNTASSLAHLAMKHGWFEEVKLFDLEKTGAGILAPYWFTLAEEVGYEADNFDVVAFDVAGGSTAPMHSSLEACYGAHWLGQKCQSYGHQVREIPSQYVKTYIKTNKNDFIDTVAISLSAA